ncbi:MAG: hypothetical protein Q4G46_12565 [Propionibacteriaceae bacterium]|nr:hypothetical protein [Propionibacteriaceae bacterium]
MNWWLIFAGIALFALAQTALLGWWLWRRGRGLVADLGVLAERASELSAILDDLTDPAQRAHQRNTVGVAERLD